MSKLVSKPLSMAASMLAGLLAGAIFKQVWRLTAGQDEAPDAADFDRRWGEVLAAAALEGAIFATVKAAARRATASRPKPAEES